jgi:hypothetical protein
VNDSAFHKACGFFRASVMPSSASLLRTPNWNGRGDEGMFAAAVAYPIKPRSMMATNKEKGFGVFVILLFTRKKDAVGHRAVTAVFEMFGELR